MYYLKNNTRLRLICQYIFMYFMFLSIATVLGCQGVNQGLKFS